MALMCMVMDFKHTKPWLCEFCGALRFARSRWRVLTGPFVGEPARETQMQSVPYVWFPICRLPVYVRSTPPFPLSLASRALLRYYCFPVPSSSGLNTRSTMFVIWTRPRVKPPSKQLMTALMKSIEGSWAHTRHLWRSPQEKYTPSGRVVRTARRM